MPNRENSNETTSGGPVSAKARSELMRGGAAHVDPASDAFTLNDRQDHFFRKITSVAPTILYVFDLRTMANVWVNRSIFAYLGYTNDQVAAMGGNVLSELMHPDDFARYDAHFARLLALGPTDIARFEYRMRHRDGGWRWLVSEEMAYARGDDDMVTQIVGSAHDVTESKEREERVSLLVREMSHRVKNLFAVVASMISLSARGETDVKTALSNVRARVNALALAHTISIGEAQEKDSALADTVRLVLTPYLDDHDIEIAGVNPSLPWRSITPIGLIVHELATNAVKYGALKEKRGTIRITIAEDGDSQSLSMDWHETVSPAPPAPEATDGGFGGVLTAQAARQLGGTLERRWHEDGDAAGMRVLLRFPA